MAKQYERQKYVVISGNPAWYQTPYAVLTYENIDAALKAYDDERARCGDNVRLARVVLDYGEKV